jgi:acyl carrier protein
MEPEIKSKLTDFIVANYLFGDAKRMPGEDESLIEKGIVDSTGILELIEFLESSFGIEVEDTETLPQNLGSISNLARFISKKRTTG